MALSAHVTSSQFATVLLKGTKGSLSSAGTMEAGRPLDINFSSGEIITIDLDALDADPGTSVVELLREGQPAVKAWIKIAVEYWKLGLLDPATDIAAAAVERKQRDQTSCPFLILPLDFSSTGDEVALPRVYSLLANLQLERARAAPKVVLKDARKLQLVL